MKDPTRVIFRPRLTEKATSLQLRKAYVFEVDPRANKHDIRQALASLYQDKGIEVAGIRTMRVKGKYRRNLRMRGAGGYSGDWKKAIVTLAKGEIETV